MRVVLSCLLSLPVVALAQGVTPVHPVTPSGVRLLPDAFLSADNVAAKTATALHGLTFIWDSSGGNWDRWTGAVTQSGTWTVSVQTVPDPCTFRAKTSVPFSINTATTTQLIAASASNKVYVCALNLVVSA
ncbi:MAG TPA: hypothetical protein VFS39_03800, partial [Nitrospira sp.]|nr:hypothetical protein [Nitrospira sp.]